MSEKLSTLAAINFQIAAENRKLQNEVAGMRLKGGGGDGTHDDMDLVTYRLDQADKRAEAADARMARVEEKLGAIQLALAGLATKDAIRNWGLAVIAIIVATGMAMGALLLQSSGNQLSAFQAGLSAIQAVAAAQGMASAPTSGATHAAPPPSVALPTKDKPTPAN